MKRKILVQRLRRAEQANGIVTFGYVAKQPKSGELTQRPVVLVRSVEKENGKLVSFTGIALNRLLDDKNTKEAIRKYLLSRVTGSLQRLR